MRTAELILDARAPLGEGPVWDHRKQVLYWVDILGHKLHRYNPESNEDAVKEFDQYVTAVVPYESEGLVLAMYHGFHRYDWDSGRLTAISDPERDKPENRFNDGKCDPVGRLVAGTMAVYEDKPESGALYSLDTDGSVRCLLQGVTTSNGLAWSADGRTMYYIDTPTQCVVAFDYDLDTGAIAGRRVAIDFSGEEGYPDGMTIDAEGMLWIAHWGGWQVSRWDPASGRKVDHIALPVPQVTSCAFGGPHLNELYITSAGVGVQDRVPQAGGLFRVTLDVGGREADFFKG